VSLVLALIPARGGSRGIPRKNVRLFAGAPLIAWTIAAAQQSHATRIIVSTDDEEIRDVARAWGAEVPFLRPAALAGDDTPDLPVFLHALEWLEREESFRPDLVAQLRPTSPLRPPGLIDLAIERLLARPSADCVRAVTTPQQNPYKMWRENADGALTPILAGPVQEAWNAPRQSLPETLWQTGHLDLIWRRTLVERGSMSGDVLLPLRVPSRYAIDLDEPHQWAPAESQALSELSLVRPTQPDARGGWARSALPAGATRQSAESRGDGDAGAMPAASRHDKSQGARFQ
jgi:N-acylneuraminate cytidylyltransferase